MIPDTMKNSAGADWVLAPGSAHAWLGWVKISQVALRIKFPMFLRSGGIVEKKTLILAFLNFTFKIFFKNNFEAWSWNAEVHTELLTPAIFPPFQAYLRIVGAQPKPQPNLVESDNVISWTTTNHPPPPPLPPKTTT
jgi:hypothetical protein